MKLTYSTMMAVAILLAAKVAISDEPAPTLAQQLQQQREKSRRRSPPKCDG